MSPYGFSGLPSDMERATLLTPVYMTLQLPRRTALVSPQGWWALTPPSHPCLRSDSAGGSFLLRDSTLADGFLLGSGMLCVARTFLLRKLRKRQTGRLLRGGKGTKTSWRGQALPACSLPPLPKSCPTCLLSFPRPAVSAFMKNETESFD